MEAPPLKRKRSVSNSSTSSVSLPSLCNPHTPVTIPDIEISRDGSIMEKMAEPEPHIPTNDDDSNEDDVQVDSDLEDGDRVIARGWPRNHDNLVKHGFRPVWTMSGGYPSTEIPADIEELLDDDGKCRGAKYLGPLRSLAWLAGLDELVEAIDSSAYTIEDCIEVVPLGAGLMWPVEWHIEQGKIPSRIADKVFGYWEVGTPPRDTLLVRDETPRGVTETPTLFNLKDIVGTSRVEKPSGKILCMKVKSQKRIGPLATKIKRLVEGGFESGEFWFRGLSVAALKSTLAFFIPQASGSNRDNEFGPGFYTANSLEHSLLYLRGGVGAIMVFKRPDLSRSTVWQPSLADWTAWVAKWTSLPLAIASHPAPPQYDTADLILGPISADKRGTGGSNVPTQSEDTQLVAISYKGCQVLSDSLFMIIFVDPK